MLYYTVGILWTAKEEFNYIVENVFFTVDITINTLNLNFES